MKKLFQHFGPYFGIATLLLLVSCKTQPQYREVINLSPRQEVLFLDSLSATQVIIEDREEGFFKKINRLDMSLQMKRNYPESTARNEILADYRSFLKKEVRNFTPAETELLSIVFQQAFQLCNKVSPYFFPKKIQLIKTNGEAYGPTAFYTRQDAIIIPRQKLADSPDELLTVMLHELFHIYSRYHDNKKRALYQIIGFKPIALPDQLVFSEQLQQRQLLNPDGVNTAYLIKLQDYNQKEVLAMPLIISKEEAYRSGQEQFFDYVQFDLYAIKPPYSKRIEVHATADGKTTLPWQEFSDFFRQIGDNTEYIIHPDEIMADNFVLLAMPDSKRDISPRGKEILALMSQILQER